MVKNKCEAFHTGNQAQSVHSRHNLGLPRKIQDYFGIRQLSSTMKSNF